MFKLNTHTRKKDQRTYRNFHCWPTKKLKEIIESPYHLGIDGHDYGPYIFDIKTEYELRMINNADKEINQLLKQRGY
jgi:hypothetical protein